MCVFVPTICFSCLSSAVLSLVICLWVPRSSLVWSLIMSLEKERERQWFGTCQLYFQILFSVIFNPLNVTSCAFQLQIQAKTLSTLSSICMWWKTQSVSLCSLMATFTKCSYNNYKQTVELKGGHMQMTNH